MGRQAIHVPRKAKGPFSLGRLLGLCINSATPYALDILKSLKENGWTWMSCNSIQTKNDFRQLVDAFRRLKSMKGWEIPTMFGTIKQFLVDLEQIDFATMNVSSMRVATKDVNTIKRLYNQSEFLKSLLNSDSLQAEFESIDTQEELVDLCVKDFNKSLPSDESLQSCLSECSNTENFVSKYEELRAVVDCWTQLLGSFQDGIRKKIAYKCHNVLSQVEWNDLLSLKNLPLLRAAAMDHFSEGIPIKFGRPLNKTSKMIKRVQALRFSDTIDLSKIETPLKVWFEFFREALGVLMVGRELRPKYLEQFADEIGFAAFKNCTASHKSRFFENEDNIIWFFSLSYATIFGTINYDPSNEEYEVVFPKTDLNVMIMILVKELPWPEDYFIHGFEKLLDGLLEELEQADESARKEDSQLDQSTSNSIMGDTPDRFSFQEHDFMHDTKPFPNKDKRKREKLVQPRATKKRDKNQTTPYSS